MRKIIIFILIISLIFVSILTINNSLMTTAKAETINIKQDQSIQNAIDEAVSGDTLIINSGKYEENIDINKAITLTGENKENTVIIGADSNVDAVVISSSNVVISNLKIKTHPSASSYLPAIYVDHSDYCTISECIIEDSKNGIWLKSSDGNTIENNIINNNDDVGLQITTSSMGNTIRDNTIHNNEQKGIYIDDGSQSNTIYRNDLVNNNPNADDKNRDNNWFYNQEGNYWSDYNSYDYDGDDIGDIYYSKNGVIDQYPLGFFLNPEPVATIESISPSPAKTGQTVTFRGHGSDDGEIISYKWYANGEVIGNSDRITHVFSSAKTYSIIFKVIDDDGDDDQEETTLVVNPSDEGGGSEDNQKPTAVIDTVSKTQAYYGEEIYFSGHGTDPDGDTITEFEWISNPDGILSSKQSFYTSTLSVGNHIIYFRVKDKYDQWSQKRSQGIEIIQNPEEQSENHKPTASINGPYYAIVNTKIDFYSAGSSDPDGDTINYQWDFGDSNTSSQKDPNHIYKKAGEYEVILTVTDENGYSDSETTTAYIFSESNFGKPVAYAGGPYTGIVDTAVTFDATESYNPNDNIVSYNWDFGDENTGSTENTQHTYTEIGEYEVTLTITDGDGNIDTDTTTAYINSQSNSENIAPVADAGGPYNGIKDSIIVFDGTDSYDINNNIVSYNWDFGDGSTSTTEKPQHIYTEEGKYTVKLKVTDSYGSTDLDTTSIEISIEQNNNNQNENSEEKDDRIVIPGFEIFAIISGIMIILILKRKKD